MLSAPATVGVKLTVVASEAPPLSVVKHEPAAASIVAVAVALVPEKVTDGAGVPVQLVSFRMVLTGFSVAEGLIAVPAGDTGTVTLLIVICASVSLPLVLIRLEYTARYRLPLLSRASDFAPCDDTM